MRAVKAVKASARDMESRYLEARHRVGMEGPESSAWRSVHSTWLEDGPSLEVLTFQARLTHDLGHEDFIAFHCVEVDKSAKVIRNTWQGLDRVARWGRLDSRREKALKEAALVALGGNGVRDGLTLFFEPQESLRESGLRSSSVAIERSPILGHRRRLIWQDGQLIALILQAPDWQRNGFPVAYDRRAFLSRHSMENPSLGFGLSRSSAMMPEEMGTDRDGWRIEVSRLKDTSHAFHGGTLRLLWKDHLPIATVLTRPGVRFDPIPWITLQPQAEDLLPEQVVVEDLPTGLHDLLQQDGLRWTRHYDASGTGVLRMRNQLTRNYLRLEQPPMDLEVRWKEGHLSALTASVPSWYDSKLDEKIRGTDIHRSVEVTTGSERSKVKWALQQATFAAARPSLHGGWPTEGQVPSNNMRWMDVGRKRKVFDCQSPADGGWRFRGMLSESGEVLVFGEDLYRSFVLSGELARLKKHRQRLLERMVQASHPAEETHRWVFGLKNKTSRCSLLLRAAPETHTTLGAERIEFEWRGGAPRAVAWVFGPPTP